MWCGEKKSGEKWHQEQTHVRETISSPEGSPTAYMWSNGKKRRENGEERNEVSNSNRDSRW